jgi:serine/threonine protein phosphatase PrpC
LACRAVASRRQVVPDRARVLADLAVAIGGGAEAISDFASAVVAAETIARMLAEVAEPEPGVTALVELANQAGGPDYTTCIIADVEPLAAVRSPGPQADHGRVLIG